MNRSGRRPMRFSVDPWDPGYGTSTDADVNEPTTTVVTDLELPDSAWRPLDPEPAASDPNTVFFVDGVRRIDARVWIEEPAPVNGELATNALPGICASYAAGVVRCTRADAQVVTTDVHRGLFTSSATAADIRTSSGEYRLRHSEAGDTEGLSLALQRHLSDAEVAVAHTARTAPVRLDDFGDNDLLVIDGPLHGREHLPRTVGFIKSHHAAYLPSHLHNLIARLDARQRTPVFKILGWDRYSWYLRLPCRPGTPWAGIVRVECNASLAVPHAISLADRSIPALCRYASTEYKDARAPQNLFPIGALERHLRRRLGDQRLLYRSLCTASATTA